MSLCRLVRANSEPQFWSSRGNQLDVAILALLVAILLFVSFMIPEGLGEDALEADDIILLIIILLRYTLQIGRLIAQIRLSHQSIFVQKHLNEIDIANIPQSQLKDTAAANQPEMQTSAFVKNAIIRLV